MKKRDLSLGNRPGAVAYQAPSKDLPVKQGPTPLPPAIDTTPELHGTTFDTKPVEPKPVVGYHPEANLPTNHTKRRDDWMHGVSAAGIDANVDARQAKALLDQAVADYHRDVTGGTMRNLDKDELRDLANLLTGRYSPLLDVLKRDFDDRSIYPGRPSVLIGRDPDGPTVWFMGWRKGDKTDIHSHNETQGSVSVHRGRVREQTWDTKTGELATDAVFKRGEGKAIPTPYIHQVSNERDELATTIHAYHPPLYMMELYQLVDGKAVMTGRWEDDERVEWEARQKQKGVE